jgi:hypothetical protein
LISNNGALERKREWKKLDPNLDSENITINISGRVRC